LFDEAGRWLEPVQEWARPADARLEWAQLRAALESALELLPEAQRLVVVLRDLDGMSGPEVCHALGLSETNQRQLLHRGRARLRATLAAQQVGEQG
jgi:RNA polymerase sigma-70 factor (ECF subfamily)